MLSGHLIDGLWEWRLGWGGSDVGDVGAVGLGGQSVKYYVPSICYMKVVSKGLFKSIREFKLLQRKLGNGSFGVVNLALHRSTGRLYAMKVIDLATVPSQVQLKLVQREIRLHSSVHHPHTIALWDTLCEEGKIYMVLEYAEQGNLFFYQNTKQTFSEPEAALFFSQTAQALQHLHSLDIMHRDLKPENLLLDRHLNIKLCDFGWSAENIVSPRSTFCGTYEYMAPEMLFSSPYDYRVDLWALGVLLYELVHGHAPFRGQTANEVKQHMLQGSYELTDSLSDSLKQLITAILKFDPQERLSLKEMLASEWMAAMQEVIVQCAEEVEVDSPSQLHALLAQTLSEKPSAKTASSTKKDRPPTRNISFNLSINNYALIKPERNQYVSPGQTYLEKKKKKEDKRCRTQAEENLLELAHSLSPTKKTREVIAKHQDKRPRVQRKARHQVRQSQQGNSPFRGCENSLFSGRTPSKIGSVLKKKSVHEKLQSAVSSMKSIQRVRTGQKNNLTSLGSTAL